MKQKRAFFLGAACTLLTLALITGVLAANGRQIVIDPTIRIKVNGEVFRPTDVNGKPVLTFAYEGTTYAPLRALAEAYGLEVGFDPESYMATVNRPGEGPETAEASAAEAFRGILDVGPRLTTFVSCADGSVYSAYWGDAGPWLFSDPENADHAGLNHAFDLPVRQFDIGQWSGFALDGDGTLWSWGSGMEGSAGQGLPASGNRTMLLENIAAVDDCMALGEDGVLWAWGRNWSASPRKIAEDVRQMEDGLFVKTDGSVWMVMSAPEAPAGTGENCIVLPPSGEKDELLSGEEMTSFLLLQKLADDGVKAEAGMFFTGDHRLCRPKQTGGVWGAETALQNAKQAVWAVNREFALDRNGKLWELGSKPRPVAENVRELFPCGTHIGWTDENRTLWFLPADEREPFRAAENVLFADGADLILLFVRADGTLWKIGGVDDPHFMNGGTWETAVPQKVLEGVRLP